MRTTEELKRKKIMIAIPCMDMIHTDFAQCLWAAKKIPDTSLYISKSSLVYDSRNMITAKALDNDFDVVIWLDSDMTFEPDVVERMVQHFEDGKDIVCGLCFTRKRPIVPVVYSKLVKEEDDRGVPNVGVLPYRDYPSELFEVQGMGFGCAMTSVRALKRIADVYGPPFYPRFGFGEDITFCWLANELGIKMYCDPTIKLGHIGNALCNEEAYLRYRDEHMAD